MEPGRGARGDLAPRGEVRLIGPLAVLRVKAAARNLYTLKQLLAGIRHTA